MFYGFIGFDKEINFLDSFGHSWDSLDYFAEANIFSHMFMVDWASWIFSDVLGNVACSLILLGALEYPKIVPRDIESPICWLSRV